MSQSSAISSPHTVSWWALKGFKEEKNTCHLAVSSCSHRTRRTWKKFRMRKQRALAPDSWGAYPRSDFSEPRLLHLPIQGKVLNSLTWDIWFSLTKSNILTFRLPALCCKTPGPIRPGSPFTSSDQFSQCYLRCSLLWGPKNSCWIKRNSQL